MKHNTPNSSNVESLDYDPRAEKLVVHFRSGRSYEYANFPESKWEDIKSSESVGRYIAEHVKGEHEATAL